MNKLKKNLIAAAALTVAFGFQPSVTAEAALRIISEHQAHVGEEVILTADPIPNSSSVEWSISGDVNPFSLLDGGRRCAFTPINSKPIYVTATLRSGSGTRGETANINIAPEEFKLQVKVESLEPVVLWDVAERKNVPANALAVNRPIKLSVSLTPTFRGESNFTWVTDASTAGKPGANNAEFVIQRSETGTSEIAVTAFNTAGTRIGSCTSTVDIALPDDVVKNSERTERAWHDWESAQSLWEQKKYKDAVEMAQKAFNGASRDQDIVNGLKSMSGQYAQFLRGSEFRNNANAQRDNGNFVEALKNARLAQIVWPLDSDAELIKGLEKKIDELRVLQQKADWLRDTASAYDQEGLYEEALDYYMQATSLVPSEAIANRVERIQQRLDLIKEANDFAIEGSVQERDGNLFEAIEAYNLSIERNPDAALKQHVTDLENVRKRRVDKAEELYREGQALQKDKKVPEAMTRYQESLTLWELPHVKDRVEEITKQAKKPVPPATEPRKLDDFGIGSKADAARLIKTADELYLDYKIDEAVATYRKALTISPSDELRNWITQLEATLRDRKQLKAANALVREANALYRNNKVKEALAKYQESLGLHANAEVAAFLKRNGVEPAPAAPAPAPAPAPTGKAAPARRGKK